MPAKLSKSGGRRQTSCVHVVSNVTATAFAWMLLALFYSCLLLVCICVLSCVVVFCASLSCLLCACLLFRLVLCGALFHEVVLLSCFVLLCFAACLFTHVFVVLLCFATMSRTRHVRAWCPRRCCQQRRVSWQHAAARSPHGQWHALPTRRLKAHAADEPRSPLCATCRLPAFHHSTFFAKR